MSQSTKYVTVSEAAELLQKDAAYVIDLLAAGLLPYKRDGDTTEGRILIPMDAVGE